MHFGASPLTLALSHFAYPFAPSTAPCDRTRAPAPSEAGHVAARLRARRKVPARQPRQIAPIIQGQERQ